MQQFETVFHNGFKIQLSIFQEEDEASWGEQLAKVLKEDITKEILTSKQFNKSLALMLSYGYCICAVVSFLLGDWMYSNVFPREDKTSGKSVGGHKQWNKINGIYMEDYH